jgi:hypothetical protein
LTRVGDLAGAFFLASSFASEEDSEEEKTDEKAERKAAVCAAAAVLVHVARAAGVVAGVGGVAVVPRAARDALAALSEAAEAVEAREKEKAEEAELAEAMGIFPKHGRTQDEDIAEAARLSSRRREAAFEAARAAAPLWSAEVGSRSENAFSPREKTSRGIVAVVSSLVRGEDGRDVMRANAVDLLLGPERDLGDVEASLRVTSAPLLYALSCEERKRRRKRNFHDSRSFALAVDGGVRRHLARASCRLCDGATGGVRPHDRRSRASETTKGGERVNAVLARTRRALLLKRERARRREGSSVTPRFL